MIQLSSGCIVIINALDELPTLDPIKGVLIQYQHGGVIVSGYKFSCAFAFRTVTSFFAYNCDHELIWDTSALKSDSVKIPKDFDTDEFHDKMKSLYKSRFNFDFDESTKHN